MATDVACFARARKNAAKTYVNGTRRKGPWFGATSELIMPKAAACAEQVALCCAMCCVLVGDVTF